MKPQPISKPDGIFPAGKNIMTPDVLGYFKLAAGYAELSEGRGMDNERIWGVTVRPDPNPRRSKLCFSEREARAYIEEMS